MYFIECKYVLALTYWVDYCYYKTILFININIILLALFSSSATFGIIIMMCKNGYHCPVKQYVKFKGLTDDSCK